jgi:hypothetical protein
VDFSFTDLEHHINPDQYSQFHVESVNSLFVRVLNGHKVKSKGIAPPFFTSTVDGGGWSVSSPGPLPPGLSPSVPIG